MLITLNSINILNVCLKSSTVQFIQVLINDTTLPLTNIKFMHAQSQFAYAQLVSFVVINLAWIISHIQHTSHRQFHNS